MKKFLGEDLNLAREEPQNNKAVDQAKKLGLKHAGFGRYLDPKSNQITHMAQDEKLVPFDKAIKTNSFKTNSGDDIGDFTKAMMPQTQELHDLLVQTYKAENYDAAELDAVFNFTGSAYVDVNKRLASLPVGTKQIQPTAQDDPIPGIISALDAAINKSRAPAEFLVFAVVAADNLEAFQPGSSFKSKGFRSTSINLNSILNTLTPDNQDIVILQIKIKKNTKGIYAADFSATQDESEFILPRGAKIDILAGPKTLSASDATIDSTNVNITFFDCVTKG